MEAFGGCLDRCGLRDLHFSGPAFTWKGKRGGEMIKERLDRFVASREWSEVFPASRVLHLDPTKSDHLPVLLEVRVNRPRRKKKKKRFRIEGFWLEEAECRDIVEQSWEESSNGDPYLAVMEKIGTTRRRLVAWSKEKFGSLKEEIARTRAKLAAFFDRGVGCEQDAEMVALEAKLSELLKLEHVYWKQRAKVLWLKDGDLNTKFFHQRACNRKRRNNLKGLRDSTGIWCTEDEQMERIVMEYFGDLFASSGTINSHLFTELFSPVVTPEMNVLLTREFELEEVYEALKQMQPMKSPGPDGFAPCFYQKFWTVVGSDVTKAVWSFMNSEEQMRRVNHTHVALIPKVKEVETVQQLRPISLCNVIYKLGSKVLANRMKGLLQEVIAPNQSAFVPGRQISDNSLLAFEISHYLKRCYGGSHGYGALKLDMSKAYDRVEWYFLEAVMTSMGFHRQWIGWILNCVKTVTYSFVLNGEPRGQLVPSRGIRQGDSISPYLFLLCAEGLSRMLSKAEVDNRVHGVCIASGAPSVNHLFFADDSFIFMRADEEECRHINEILGQYEQASGQCVNFLKSSICFSKNVPMESQLALSELLGVERVDRHDKYLGLPTEISYSKAEAFQFVLEKTKGKMKNWKDKTLSLAGKEVMIKAVVQAVPTYVMSCFELPKHMCMEMHRFMAEFWWGDSDRGRKIHWMAWDRMCAPKEVGGMGFRNMWQYNSALLAKQGWRLLRYPDSLLARCLKAKYYPDTDFLKATIKSGASYAWRSLMKGKEVLEKGVRYVVGRGSNISVWNDPWLPRPFTFRPSIPVMEGLEDLRVADLIDEGCYWSFDWLEELFTVEEVEMIKRMPLSIVPREDRLVWHFSKHGEYCVRSGYRVARECESLGSQASSSEQSDMISKMWKMVWRSHVMPKTKAFIWRLLKGILPTRAALVKKRVNLEDQFCLFCRGEVESDLHVFKNCNVVACLWLLCPIGLRARNHAATSMWDWMEDVMQQLRQEDVDIFLMVLWTIWEERNKLLWNGGVFNPAGAILWSMKLLEEYRSCHPRKAKQTGLNRRGGRWTNPPSGRLKLNCDGSFRLDSNSGGAGVVARDHHGQFIAAHSVHLPHLGSVLHSEAEACRLSLRLAVQQGWENVEVESDSILLVNALNKSGELVSDIAPILGDCWSLMNMLGFCKIQHVNRKANGVADRLAHFASRGRAIDLTLNEAPALIEDLLYEDSCNMVPNQGSAPKPRLIIFVFFHSHRHIIKYMVGFTVTKYNFKCN